MFNWYRRELTTVLLTMILVYGCISLDQDRHAGAAVIELQEKTVVPVAARPVAARFKVTATSYACQVCTGSDGKTLLRPGMMAVSDDLAWLWGRHVRIGQREFFVVDRMANYWRNRVDIYTPREHDAWQWGKRQVMLEVEK